MTDIEPTPSDNGQSDEATVFAAVIDDIEQEIRERLATVVSSGATDIATFASRLGPQLVFAHQTGNEEVIASVARQAKMLAELQRIRVSDAAWDTFYGAILAATRVAVRLATKILTSGAV